jgi:EAL and modified HD-GYP domain-containing signal transduction protein
MAEACVARQPIFGTAGDVAGYELLYRRTSSDTAARGAGRGAMSADDIVHAFVNIGLDQLTNGRPAFVNFTREMLLTRAYTLMPPHSVIELLENVEPDEDVEAACQELVDAGYSLALDGFTWSSGYRRLLELATIVKVDVLNKPAQRLDEIAQRHAVYAVRLLAKRVETAEARAMCAGLGYELFQGHYYHARPEIAKARALRSDEITIAQAMNVLRDARTTDADAEAACGADMGLSHKLLRIVNSAPHGGGGIESMKHAVQLTGRTELSKWLALLLVSSIAAREATHRELQQLAVQRARMCELLTASIGRDRDTSASFLVGLFSVLDAISGMPMAELLESITLEQPLREALISRTGPYAGALTTVEAYEQGAWSTAKHHATSSGIDAEHVGAAYGQSLAWTRDRLPSLAGT